MLKNLKRRALAAQCDPDMNEPDFTALLNRFVNQNVEAETSLRQRDKVQAYERGRADMQAAIQMGAVPASYQASAHHPPAIPSQPDTIAAWHDPMASEARITRSVCEPEIPIDVLEEPFARPPAPEADRLTFSQALQEYVEENLTSGGNADARSAIQLVVQFLIDIMDDPIIAKLLILRCKAARTKDGVNLIVD